MGVDTMIKQSISSEVLQKIIELLLKNKCLKYGDFTLKNGSKSNYYIDLREATFSPALYCSIVDAIKQLVARDRGNVAIVGIPYGVVPIASAVAYDLKVPYFPVRKETKSYGNQCGSTALDDHEFILIEDVMSTGSSIIETIKKLEGKRVTDVIVVVDRESGGVENLKAQYPDIRLRSVLKASEFHRANSH